MPFKLKYGNCMLSNTIVGKLSTSQTYHVSILKRKGILSLLCE